MTNVFLYILLAISFIFFVLMLVIFACQWVIYFRIERTTLEQNKIIAQQERN